MKHLARHICILLRKEPASLWFSARRPDAMSQCIRICADRQGPVSQGLLQDHPGSARRRPRFLIFSISSHYHVVCECVYAPISLSPRSDELGCFRIDILYKPPRNPRTRMPWRLCSLHVKRACISTASDLTISYRCCLTLQTNQNSATSCTQMVRAPSRRWRTCTGKRLATSLFGAASLRSQIPVQYV